VTQGHHMGGPGQVEVQVEYGPAGNILGVYIGGTAVVVAGGAVKLGSPD